MTPPARTVPISMSTLFRRKPVAPPGSAEAHGEAHLERSITTFQLTLFGVGATVGTGIFFVLPEAVPDAGPAVIIAFLVAGLAAGLAAICYAEMASSVPVSGSSYSYSYATMGELVAIAIGACLLLEYGVSAAATAVGWSGYLNKLLDNLFGFQFPQALSAAPLTEEGVESGWFNLPAAILVALCCFLLIRGASESARTNAIMVIVKLCVLVLFAGIAFTAFSTDHFAGFSPFGAVGITAAAGAIFFSFIGLDAVSTAGDEVKDPQKAMPRAIMGALITVVTVYLLVAVAGIGAQAWPKFASPDQSEAGLAVIIERITESTWPGTLLAAGAVISIFSVTLVVLYGQTRILFAMGRDGLLPDRFAQVSTKTMTPVWNTVVVCVVVGLLAGLLPIGKLIDMVSIGTLAAFSVVSAGVLILRNTMPDLERSFRVPGYPVTPILSIAACLWILSGLKLVTYLAFALWVLVFVAIYLVWGRKSSKLNHLTAEQLDAGDTTPLGSRFKVWTGVLVVAGVAFFAFGAVYNHGDHNKNAATLTDTSALLTDWFTAVDAKDWAAAGDLTCGGTLGMTSGEPVTPGQLFGGKSYDPTTVGLIKVPQAVGDNTFDAQFDITERKPDDDFPPETRMSAVVRLGDAPCVQQVSTR
ncbi:amino acid permease [Gordonia amarae]|uniref:Amino acid permease n=2 Tax=Gordonia amarae TaxID=36821 RepID=A0A857KRB6_9ACTN|nr:amino acid permease [Gordonia amarae]GAB04765.1 putative amino acid transporter [Gordonia amarae NBRC 15530]MCS3880693.1 amino acid transporter [Gordonia amarae]QHN18990.1 amino acid permease [Gordonia amarae]QHN23465.1 amino acid permease [Gordonia amarae]QHN32365.1 amino acid permease [Gordonia amarae]